MKQSVIKKYGYTIAMLVLVVLVGVVILSSKSWVQADGFVVFTFCVNILLFAAQFLQSMQFRPFGFDMMFWLFNLFFFGFAPLLQHLTNTYTWDLQPQADQIWKINLLILLWSLCYMAGRLLCRKYKPSKAFSKLRAILRGAVLDVSCWLRPVGDLWKQSRLNRCVKNRWNQLVTSANRKLEAPIAGKNRTAEAKRLLQRGCIGLRGRLRRRDMVTKTLDILLVISVLITLYHIAKVGFFQLFSRATADMSLGSDTTSALILTHVLKNAVLFTAAFHVLRARNRRKLDVRTVVSVACLLISCFPTALPRNMMASFYGGLLVLILRPKKKSGWFTFLIFGGLVLAFPAIDVFRNMTLWESEGLWEVILSSIRNSYLVGHYDAHQNTVSALNYVNKYGLAWGGQFLGALLFFVPRSIWPAKPIGTGHMMIIDLRQFDFTNVSASLMLEGYVNFGVVGVILLGVLVGFLARRLDKAYWQPKQRWTFFRIIYPFSMLQFFFLLRGDMMSGWAYLCAQLVMGAVLYLFVKCVVRWKKRQAADTDLQR